MKVMSLVWEHFPGGGSELLVMLKFGDLCNDLGEHTVHPSMEFIARAARISRSQAQRTVHRLIDRGWVSVVGNEGGGKPGTTRIYRINVERLTGSVDATPTGRTDDTPTGRTGATPTGRTHAARRVAPMRPKPTTEPKQENIGIGDLPEWLPAEKWEAFKAHRRALKSKMTPQAEKLALRALDDLRKQGNNPVAVIEQSIVNGWKGLFRIAQGTAIPQREPRYADDSAY